MTPKEVWAALKEKGVTERSIADAYNSQENKAKAASKKIADNKKRSELVNKFSDTPAEDKKAMGLEENSPRKKPRKQLEYITVDTNGMVFKNAFEEVMYKSRETNKLKAKQTMQDTGVSEEEARKMNANIAAFTGSGYKGIRDLSNKEYNEARHLVEKYIEKAPPYDGEIYRGMTFNDNGTFLEELKCDNILDMQGISSWSNNKIEPKRRSV